jgi:hypothetical protein
LPLPRNPSAETGSSASPYPYEHRTLLFGWV